MIDRATPKVISRSYRIIYPSPPLCIGDSWPIRGRFVSSGVASTLSPQVAGGHEPSYSLAQLKFASCLTCINPGGKVRAIYRLLKSFLKHEQLSLSGVVVASAPE